jgi:phosphoglycolate phosphatase
VARASRPQRYSCNNRVKPALIFDLDGTLVDSLRGIADTLNRTLTAHGLPGHSDANVRTFVGDGLANLILRSLPQGSDQRLLDSVLPLYRQDYERSWKQGSQPYPGIADMLSTLSREGFPLAVLSNKVHAFTVEMVESTFPDIPFAAILGQHDGIPHKPNPHGALELAGKMNIPPADCIIIGDSTIDFLTAQNAGMRAISVDWGYHDRSALEAVGSTMIVSSPDALIEAIMRGNS